LLKTIFSWPWFLFLKKGTPINFETPIQRKFVSSLSFILIICPGRHGIKFGADNAPPSDPGAVLPAAAPTPKAPPPPRDDGESTMKAADDKEPEKPAE
jgi:hypothetical protein